MTVNLSSRAILSRIIEEIGYEAEGFARAVIRPHSKTLASDVYFRRKRGGAGLARGALTLDYYWAIYLHDGRRPQYKSSGFFVFWRKSSRSKDPRLQGGRHTARAKSEEKPLTKAQFERGLKANARAIKAGAKPPMIVTDYVRGTRPTRFFSKGMDAFGLVAEDVIGQIIDEINQDIADEYSGSFKTVIS